MRSFPVRILCRLVAAIAAAMALYYEAWLPEHADHVLAFVTERTKAALQMTTNQATFTARDNLERLQPIGRTSQLSVAYHLVYAVNLRILGRNDEAIEHYTAALAADHRPEIYFDRGSTYLEQKRLDAATADIALATRFNPYYLDSLDPVMRERVAAFNKAAPFYRPPG